MKKLVYFFGIFALIAGFVTSCGDDDDDDEGNGSNGGSNSVVQKKLAKVVVDGYDSYEFKYDNDGKCTSFLDLENNQLIETTNFKYEGNKIVEECCLLDGTVRVTTTIILNSKGYVESVTRVNGGSETTMYEYDNQGRLISESYTDEDGESVVKTYTWENGNISKVDVHEKDGDNDFRHSLYIGYTNSAYPNGIENKAGINYTQFDDEFVSPYYKVAGVALDKLPLTVKYSIDEGSAVQTITWTLDSDGYPIRSVSDYGSDKDTFEFVWE